MKLFGLDIKRAKKSYYPGVLSGLRSGEIAVSQNTFYDLYRNNNDIRQAVKKIAGTVARNGIYLEDKNKNILDNEALDNEVEGLFSYPTFNKFKIELFKNYLLSGELYIKPLTNMNGQVAGFEIIDSRAITKTTDGRGHITAFNVNTRDGKQYILKPEEIAFFKLEDDTRDTLNGMGLLHGILYDALNDLEAQKCNYSLYKNSAIPGAMLFLDGDLSSDEMQIAKDMFEAQFRGSENQHKILVAGGVKDVKTLAITPRDMEFINQRHLTTEKVSATFGVPKSILGYIDNVNYSNAEELRKEFIEGTIRPYEKELENIINTCLQKFMPVFGDKFNVRCDGEQLEEKMEYFEGQRKDIASGILTINEVRIDRGLEPLKDENADKPLISGNYTLLEDITIDAVLSNNEE